MNDDYTNPIPLRVAILDLYDGEENQGMRAIRELLTALSGSDRVGRSAICADVYETRLKDELPGLDYDVYVSTGGPGSPFDGEGKLWERRYFRWIDAVWNHNERRPASERKHTLFICHSFQMMCRFFEVARITARRSESFGVFPVRPTAEGLADPLFDGLDDPFYAADFRHWQAIQPDAQRLDELGGSVLALEKKRPRIPLERATMAVRVTPELVGVQFHPEADPPGMRIHFGKPERAGAIIKKHGQEKYERIMHRLNHPAYLKRTYDAVIPNFFGTAVATQRPEAAGPVPAGV